MFGYLIALTKNSNYYEYYVNLGIDIFIYSAPWLIVAYAVRNYSLFKKYLYASALIVLLSFLTNYYIFEAYTLGSYSYSQSNTYKLLPVAIILLDKIFDRRSLFNCIIFFTAVIFMLAMGARGPFACLVMYMVLKIFLLLKLSIKKLFAGITISILLFVPLYLCYYDILSYLLNLFYKLDFSTRVVSVLLDRSFFIDYHRSRLIKYSLDLIIENPFFGVGLGSDRIFLSQKMGGGNSLFEMSGWYPHNIILELFLHFGIVLGIVIVLYAIISILLILKNAKKDSIDVICIFIGVGFFPLLFSGSYLISPLFFMLIGLCLYQKKVILSKHRTSIAALCNKGVIYAEHKANSIKFNEK